MKTMYECEFCSFITGPHDAKSFMDSTGAYCGKCMTRMGLDGDLFSACGLCKLPIMSNDRMIDDEDHDCEYCASCHDLLRRAGF